MCDRGLRYAGDFRTWSFNLLVFCIW